MKVNCRDCKKAKHMSEEDKNNLIKRLNVIEGQVRGIKQMIENDRLCDEVLTQVSAVNHSLKSIGNVLLKNHLATCVINDINAGNMEIIDDVVDLFDKLNS